MSKIAILSVDDEKIILDSIRIQLEKNFQNQYIFEYAESADEALEVVDGLINGGIDILLILSDYQMPGMKGDEFASELKSRMPSVNIVMLTGQMPMEISRDLLDKNIILKVINKPWREDDLVGLIKQLSENVEG
ncbi:MAG: response regulator [Bacteroidota bacterium]|jgi:CheY-like chemotaxis protein